MMQPNPATSSPSETPMSDPVLSRGLRRSGSRHTAFVAPAAMKAPIQVQVDRELGAIPRGDLPQNLYRAAYEQARLNGLGSRAKVGDNPEDAHVAALEVVRAHYPDFAPTLR